VKDSLSGFDLFSPYALTGNVRSLIALYNLFIYLFIQLLANHLEPLTEQQLLGLTNLQQSSQQAEDALSQGMEALQQSLAETLAGSLGPSGSSGNVANYMGQMAMAMGKLGTLENFLRQASIFFVSLPAICQHSTTNVALGDHLSMNCLLVLSSLSLKCSLLKKTGDLKSNYG
jgi:transcription factor TGA